jgi:hypothetical protein
MRRLSIVLALGLVLAAAGASARSSFAAPSTKLYTTSLTPSTAGAGAQVDAVLTLGNSSNSSQTLGSENVTMPNGYSASVTSIVQPANKTWTASVVDGVIQLRAKTSGDALDRGTTVAVHLSVSVPCTAPSTTTWKTEAKQSNAFNGTPGNDFKLEGQSQPTMGFSGSCGFKFVSSSSVPGSPAVASPQLAGVPISVTVDAIDGDGNVTAAFNGSATLSGTFSSTNGTPSYSALNFTNGVATGTATTYTAETGRTLTATSGSITGASNLFDVDPGPADHLGFVQQPTTTVVKGVVGGGSNPITVDVYDAYGNVETPAGNQADVTLAIANDAGSGPAATTLGGTPTQTSASGIATFDDITLDHSGIGFTLSASAAGLTSATSDPFDILDGCPGGVTTCTLSSSDKHTSVTTDYPSQTHDSTLLSMSATGAQFDCDGTQTAKGSIVTIHPAGGYLVGNPISVTLRFDKVVAPGTGVSNFVLCVDKQDTTGFHTVSTCPKHLRSVDLPCISKANRNGVGDLVIVMLMTSDDPGAGLY